MIDSRAKLLAGSILISLRLRLFYKFDPAFGSKFCFSKEIFVLEPLTMDNFPDAAA
jgi:hypothetical protein